MQRNIFQRIVFCGLMLPLLLSQMGCLNYYKAIKSTPSKAPTQILELQNKARYFVLRNGNIALSMTDISLSGDKKTLQCRLDTVPQYHQLHLKRGHKKGTLRYEKKTEEFVLNEVHLYISEDTLAKAGNTYTFALDKVQKMEIIEKDGGRTTGSHVVGFLCVVLGALVVFGFLWAASDPFGG